MFLIRGRSLFVSFLFAIFLFVQFNRLPWNNFTYMWKMDKIYFMHIAHGSVSTQLHSRICSISIELKDRNYYIKMNNQIFLGTRKMSKTNKSNTKKYLQKTGSSPENIPRSPPISAGLRRESRRGYFFENRRTFCNALWPKPCFLAIFVHRY